MFRFDLDVAMFPAWYLPRHVRRAGMTFAGFPLFEPDPELPRALAEFLDEGDPPVVFSNASWRSDLDGYYSTALDAARRLGRRSVFVGDRSPEISAGRDDALSTGFASFHRLLPRSAALVHHGGIGTVARAMAEATPQLVMPWAADQPFNAGRVESLGVGRKVGSRATRGQLGATLKEVLESQPIRAGSRRASRRLAPGPDYQEALRSLERLVADSRV
jgi:rhamnosyltransferase subunit B